jgi:threonine/homoserine/homoserine lactone efflux protein
MPDAHQLLLFVLAGWLLNLTPGPDVLYIVSNSLRGGRNAGLAAGLGITAGCFVHVVAAALGVGALLATSTLAFDMLRLLGAAYLFWVGARLLFGRKGEPALANLAVEEDREPQQNLRGVFVGGFLTNVLNPKVALFFLAFVPQFIPADTSDKTGVFLALGILFNINSLPVNAGWALAAAWMARREAVQRSLRRLDQAAGLMFLGFGLRLAFSDNPVPSRP